MLGLQCSATQYDHKNAYGRKPIWKLSHGTFCLFFVIVVDKRFSVLKIVNLVFGSQDQPFRPVFFFKHKKVPLMFVFRKQVKKCELPMRFH